MKDVSGRIEENRRVMINIACGERTHHEWTNLDLAPNRNVIGRNILKRLPFGDDSVDVAYSSHFLEHLTPDQAAAVLGEVLRVLRPDGVVRIVVPDLENQAAEYLEVLRGVRQGDAVCIEKYDWMQIEILDQLTRMTHDGRMKAAYAEARAARNLTLVRYVKERVGVDVLTPPGPEVRSILQRLCSATFGGLRRVVARAVRDSVSSLRLLAAALVLPAWTREQVLVRAAVGERHRWMYDEVSLSRLLCRSGFDRIERCDFRSSRIEGFQNFFLDANPDGSPYKGCSSLYVEAQKPSESGGVA